MQEFFVLRILIRVNSSSNDVWVILRHRFSIQSASLRPPPLRVSAGAGGKGRSTFSLLTLALTMSAGELCTVLGVSVIGTAIVDGREGFTVRIKIALHHHGLGKLAT